MLREGTVVRSALITSLKVLAFDVPLLLLFGIFFGWLLARKSFPGKRVLSILLLLPIALPPAVVGLYLLMMLGHLPLMKEAGILFSFPATAIAAMVPSLPIMISAARTGFRSIPGNIEDAARTLGYGEWHLFRRITLPLCRRQIFAGLALSSARALGEFGVTLMIAGNIPGRTQTLPLYIYSQVESLNLSSANIAASLLAILGIGSILCVRRMEDGDHERIA